MAIEDALAYFREKLKEWGMLGEISIEEMVLVGVPRIKLTRETPRFSRYVEFHETDPGSSWTHMLSFSEYDSPSDTDGRGGGDLAYVADFVRAWLVDLVPLSGLPRVPGEPD